MLGGAAEIRYGRIWGHLLDMVVLKIRAAAPQLFNLTVTALS